ncbi:hypothetical protein Tco_0052882 [Tanacetum coccineum]
MQKESVSKQGRKTAKSKTTAHKDQSFDDLDDFGAMDYMETEDAHNEKGVSTEDQVSIVKPDEGTDKPKVSTDKIDEGTAELKNGNSYENATPTATPTVFGDDETIAEFLIARKVQEEWETEEKNKKLAEEEATKVALIRDYDDIQARIKADSILAARLQEKEKEKFIIEERAKLLHDTITAQKRFLTQQRAAKIRSRPPTRTQLRNQMMTYLKHVRGKKHSDMKTKNFEEIHVLYKKVKMSDENFIAISSAEDERRIKDVNKKATGIKKDDNIKEESKEKESTKKRKLGTRKKMKSRKRIFRQDASQDDQTDSEKESGELRLCLTIATDEDKEVDYEILDKKYPIIEWKTEYLGTKPQFDKTKRLEEINLNVIDDYVPITSDEDEFWNSQQDWNVKKYPLRRKVLLQMLELKLESEEDINMALELIRFVKKHKNWLVHKQTACGKDFSNPFMVDNLPKICPRLYALERHQNVTIHTKLIDYSLVNSFRRNPRSGQEVAASEFSHLNHSLSHRPVSVKPDISKPDISKASSAGGKLHILKPSCERNGITPTPKESLSPTSGSKVPNSPLTDSDMEGKNEESYKFPIAMQHLWSQDVRGDPDSGIGSHWRSSDSGMYKFILILRALAVFRFRRALAVFRFWHAFTKNGIACIYLEGPPHNDFSLMDILPGKSTRYAI